MPTRRFGPQQGSSEADPASRPAATGGTTPSSSSGASAGSKSSDSGPSSGPRKKKILVVDDSFTSLEMQQLALADNAYEIVLARNGREAITKAVAERPDLILMDFVMPWMDGVQALRWLRAFPMTKNIPIFIVTTRSDQTSMEVAKANGCSEYLIKPLKEHELLDKVRAHLGE